MIQLSIKQLHTRDNMRKKETIIAYSMIFINEQNYRIVGYAKSRNDKIFQFTRGIEITTRQQKSHLVQI